MKDPAPLERAVKQTVKSVLNEAEAYWHMPLPPGNLHTVDFLACVPVRITADMVGKTIGLFVAVEAKRPGKKTVTTLQAETMKRVRAAGGVAVVVNQVEVEAVRSQLSWALRHGYVIGRLGQGG